MSNLKSQKLSLKGLGKFISSNAIPLLFGVAILFGMILTNDSPVIVFSEIAKLFMRNAVLVLALIIPVLAGVGLNFSVAVGAIAAQLGILIAIDSGMTGFTGFIGTIVISTMLALLFGFLAGKVLVKTSGYEMIASLFLVYIANAIYQIICLFLAGRVFPVKTQDLLLNNGVGLRNTVDLRSSIGGSLDGAFGGLEVSVLYIVIALALGMIIYSLRKYRDNPKITDVSKLYLSIGTGVVVALISLLTLLTNILPANIVALRNIKLPISTCIVIAVITYGVYMLPKTKLGYALKAVNDEEGSNVAGYDVERLKLISIVLSIIIAAWGQVIFLQNTGVMITYASHTSVGMFSVLTLIVGGASIRKASVRNVFIGLFLFHGFIVIMPRVFYSLMPEMNIYEVLRGLVFNGTILYAFIQVSRRRKNETESAEKIKSA